MSVAKASKPEHKREMGFKTEDLAGITAPIFLFRSKLANFRDGIKACGKSEVLGPSPFESTISSLRVLAAVGFDHGNTLVALLVRAQVLEDSRQRD